ncbi:MAG: D-alanyl-D-alanine endopeptidase (penicillin-binding protein 7) [Myxococcota bacterium]|jgi:D-alanyl-D-alanine endopeptidase (penicillin-binding protein 7)
MRDDDREGFGCLESKSIDMPTGGWSNLSAVKKRSILILLRTVVTINLVGSAVVLSGMMPDATDAVPSQREVVSASILPQLTPSRQLLFEALRENATSSVHMAARPTPQPAPVEPAALAVVEPPASADNEGAWSPPVWFPEASREDLWVLDGMGAPAEHTRPPRGFRSRAAFVYDLDSGRVLLEHAADDRRPVASLTKLISALAVVSSDAPLEDTVCLDRSMLPSWPGAGSRMKYGRCTTGWDLLGAALVRSDNGAALALAAVSHLPLAPFVDRMNEVSRDLGMDMSSFADPSGVQDDNLSTARDMTRAVAAAAMHPILAPVASAPYWDVEYEDGLRKRMHSTNRLHSDKGVEVLAAKTGYTDTALHCFSAVVRTSSGRTIAFTTLGARRGRHRWYDVADIIAWAERQ